MLVVLLAVVVCGLGGDGGTRAFFRTEAMDGPHQVGAGTLRLTVGGQSGPLSVGGLAPGQQRLLAVLTVRNSGDLPGALSLTAVDIENSGGVLTPDESEVDPDNHGDLGRWLRLTVGERSASGTLTPLAEGVGLGELHQHQLTVLQGNGPDGAVHTLQVWVEVDPAAGNEIQGDRTTFRLRADLRQS